MEKKEFTFNALNELRGFLHIKKNGAVEDTSEYRYFQDENGKKVLSQRKNADGTWANVKEQIWQGNNVIWNKKGSTEQALITTGNQHLGEVRNNGVKDSVLLYLNNHLGSVQQVLDTNGNLLASYKLSPYGNMEGYKGSVQTAYHFTGKEWVDELGMYDFGARYYDPDAVVWTSVDAMRQYHSPYNYCGNDPINCIDRDGNLGNRVQNSFSPNYGFRLGKQQEFSERAEGNAGAGFGLFSGGAGLYGGIALAATNPALAAIAIVYGIGSVGLSSTDLISSNVESFGYRPAIGKSYGAFVGSQFGGQGEFYGGLVDLAVASIGLRFSNTALDYSLSGASLINEMNNVMKIPEVSTPNNSSTEHSRTLARNASLLI